MGVNFNALFSHTFDDSTILSVPDLLNNDQKLADKVKRHEFYIREIKPWYWDIDWSDISNEASHSLQAQDVWDSYRNYLEVRHGTYWSIRFSRRICLVSYPKQWYEFLMNNSSQTGFREFCRELARIFNSPRALYLPDSAYSTANIRYKSDYEFESTTLEQLEGYAVRNFGLPKDFLTPTRSDMRQNLEEIARSDAERHNMQNRIYDTYFIDDFRDLKDR